MLCSTKRVFQLFQPDSVSVKSCRWMRWGWLKTKHKNYHLLTAKRRFFSLFVPVQWQQQSRPQKNEDLETRTDDIKFSSASIKGIELEWFFFFSSSVEHRQRSKLDWLGMMKRKIKTQSETTWIFEVLLSCCCSFLAASLVSLSVQRRNIETYCITASTSCTSCCYILQA